jgi:Ser/Thr protein kinase RdoA (MazF antagonist)
MRQLDYVAIVKEAWEAFAPDQPIESITDLSPMVSTNQVYKVQLYDEEPIFAKLSYFGTHVHFHEEHSIINQLARRLPPPYENVLARSLRKHGRVFTYRYQDGVYDVWVVFYHAVPIEARLPRRLEESHIARLGEEIARFHLACSQIADGLPHSSKSLRSDILDLQRSLKTEEGKLVFAPHIDFIRYQTDLFLNQLEHIGYDQFQKIPIFADWNIGNFSVSREGVLFSRWDYDWFRMASRVMDFYFLSRVCSDIGDRTVFSYLAHPLTEERFHLFLRHYQAIFPLSEAEIRFIPEAYRFFLLHYVVNFGRHFFHPFYATRLLQETLTQHLPNLNSEKLAEQLLQVIKPQNRKM